MAITDDESRNIKGRYDKATPGPWISFIEGRDHTSGSSFIRTSDEDIELIGATDKDLDFIASCRQDVPRLTEEIERLKQLLDDNNIDH